MSNSAAIRWHGVYLRVHTWPKDSNCENHTSICCLNQLEQYVMKQMRDMKQAVCRLLRETSDIGDDIAFWLWGDRVSSHLEAESPIWHLLGVGIEHPCFINAQEVSPVRWNRWVVVNLELISSTTVMLSLCLQAILSRHEHFYTNNL